MADLLRMAVVGHIEWVQFIPVERFPRAGEVVHARDAFTRAAGGGGVVAAVLAELGAQVDFFCALGDDQAGRAAAAQLQERGIRLHVAWRAAPTRLAVTLLDEHGERTIVTIGDRLAPAGADPLEWDLLERVAGVYFTAGDADALRRARHAPVLVASPRAREALAEPGAAIDALVYSSHDSDEQAWAQGALTPARLTVRTEGARGGHWSGTSEGGWEAMPAAREIHDAYGCGDSFAAGFTFGLARGLPVAEAAALGARCGTECLMRPGAP